MLFRIDDIIDCIEDGEKHNTTSGQGYVINWVAWENRFNRIIVALWSKQPNTPLNFADMDETTNRFETVWGTRATEMQHDDVIIVETLRVIDDSQTAFYGSDADADELIR